MHKFVFHNDQIVPLEQSRLSPGQIGLLSGWGVFTTLRISEAQPFAFERHWHRLTTDAKRIDLPLSYTSDFIRESIFALLKKNQVSEGCLRVYFVLNRGGIWAGDEKMPLVDLIMYTINLPTRSGGAKLGVMEHGRHAAHPLAGTKVISWLHNVWSVEQAHSRGLEDALLINERNEVAECTASNIFVVKNGRVSTPPLSSGCLSGVTRQILLEHSSELPYPLEEKTLKLEDVYSADEVFITSTTRHLQGVSQIESQGYKNVPGVVTEALRGWFVGYFEEYLAKARVHA